MSCWHVYVTGQPVRVDWNAALIQSVILDSAVASLGTDYIGSAKTVRNHVKKTVSKKTFCNCVFGVNITTLACVLFNYIKKCQ